MSEVSNPLAVSLQAVAHDVSHYLKAVSDEVYARKLDVLSGSTVGQHTRHFIEFFQCLHAQVNTPEPCVNYSARKRDIRIEVDSAFAHTAMLKVMNDILGESDQWDRLIPMRTESDESAMVQTTYAREILYGVEHCIHHLAIIKIGLKAADPDLNLPEHFGIAPSTVKYRQQCAQ